MKLLFVIDNLGSGGAQRQMVNLALGLQQRGHQIEFFIYYPQYDHFADLLHQANIPIHKYQKRWRFSFRVMTALHSRIKLGKYDAILSFLDTPNFYSEIACIGIQHPPLVVSERSAFSDSGPILYQRLLKRFHTLAQSIIVNSYYHADQILHHYLYLQDKLQVIYNGLDLSVYFPRPVLKKPRRFLSVGSVIPGKNVAGLARALAEYKILYGDPPTIDWAGEIYSSLPSQREYEMTQAILRENNLEKNWNWLGVRKDLPILYPAYEALIHPSLREGLSNAVCEAMACGLPILLSDVGEHPRLVNSGVNGKSFNPNSPREIARTMHEFLCLDDSQKMKMGMSVRSFAEREFGMDVFVDRYERLFESLIS